jgi:coenzyme F420-reducing hydrogenase gamma subunit
MAVGTCGIMGGVMGLYKYTNGMKMHDSKPTAEKSFFKPTAVVEAIKRQ